jgi:hypothetical protein
MLGVPPQDRDRIFAVRAGDRRLTAIELADGEQPGAARELAC